MPDAGDGLRGDAFAAAGEAQPFGGRGLDAHAGRLESENLRDPRSHG